MKKISILLLAIVTFFTFTACASSGDNAKASKSGANRSVTLTIGASEKLTVALPPEVANQTIIWTSSNERVARVSNDGTVTAVDFEKGGESKYGTRAATGTAVITAKTQDGQFEESITVTATTHGTVHIMSLPPLKDQFKDHFMIGNIMNPQDAGSSGISNQRLTHHYNILTAENDMKPGYLSPGKGSYNFNTANRMVNAALASGMKVHGHTLLWHSQNAPWMASVARSGKEAALETMKKYITDVVTHFKGRIYSWDVINEGFPDGVTMFDDWTKVMRTAKNSHAANPWYAAIGSDFVYEAFLAARLADPDALLFYNDYNLNDLGKATVTRNMVQDVNDRYKREYPNEKRLLIDGIGMQSHHNLGVTRGQVKDALDLFRPLGVKIAITELDVLAMNWGQFSSGSSATNNAIKEQAMLYNELMELFIENADIIDRVTWWGVSDNQSWRARGVPLLFDSQSRAKPAYYRTVEVLEY